MFVSLLRDPSRPKACVPSLFRQKQETNERRPSMTIGQPADEVKDLEYMRCSSTGPSDNTQIYEGTNQIQRMVMARQLLKIVS
jgi:hypothetical protein